MGFGMNTPTATVKKKHQSGVLARFKTSASLPNMLGVTVIIVH